MSSARTLALAATAAAFALLSAARRAHEQEATVPALERGMARVSACADHGCGCPHEDVHASCCCDPGVAGESLLNADSASFVPDSFVPDESPRAPAVVAREGDPPASTLVAFHCSGGKRGPAGVSPDVPAAHVARSAGAPRPAARTWSELDEPGPPYDLGSEPRTPPPRCARRTELARARTCAPSPT